MNRLQLKRKINHAVKEVKKYDIKNMKFDFNFRHDDYMRPVLRIFCNGVNIHYGVNKEHPAFVLGVLHALEKEELNILNYNKGEMVVNG